MIVPWGRDRRAVGFGDTEGGFMKEGRQGEALKSEHTRRVINGSLLKSVESCDTLPSLGGTTSREEPLSLGDYTANTIGEGLVTPVDAHAHNKLLDYYAGGDYSQIPSLAKNPACQALSTKPRTVEFLDLLVEGCATQ